LVFFVSIAFALIPANFITIIIREKEANTKHLQIVSGISLLAYWLSNFIFELIKYFTTGAICLGMMAAYGQIVKEMWIVYFMYGISMIPFTYCFSFIFKLEASAQNFIILKNFLFGALGGSIIFILRINDSTLTYAKGIASILRIIPAFALSYGFIESLS
jgi:ATP-binding cassette subfamily A (ABC1) protein 3